MVSGRLAALPRPCCGRARSPCGRAPCVPTHTCGRSHRARGRSPAVLRARLADTCRSSRTTKTCTDQPSRRADAPPPPVARRASHAAPPASPPSPRPLPYPSVATRCSATPESDASICDGARFAPPCACASRKQVEPAGAERALRGDRSFSWPQGAWLLGERGRLGAAPSRPSPPGGHAPCGHEKRRSPRSARSALAGSTCLRDAQAHGGAKRAPSQIEASVSRVATHRVATPDMRSLPQIGRSRSQPPAPSAAGAVRDQQGPRRDRVRHRRGCARAHARARIRPARSPGPRRASCHVAARATPSSSRCRHVSDSHRQRVVLPSPILSHALPGRAVRARARAELN